MQKESRNETAGDEFVVCPKCDGSKLNPHAGANVVDPSCKVCNGEGEVTRSRHETLKQVSANIQQKIKERGIKLTHD